MIGWTFFAAFMMILVGVWHASLRSEKPKRGSYVQRSKHDVGLAEGARDGAWFADRAAEGARAYPLPGGETMQVSPRSAARIVLILAMAAPATLMAILPAGATHVLCNGVPVPHDANHTGTAGNDVMTGDGTSEGFLGLVGTTRSEEEAATTPSVGARGTTGCTGRPVQI